MIYLKTETLYLMSGAPSSGKSTFLSRVAMRHPVTNALDPLPEGSVISSDALRKTLFGEQARVVDGRPIMEPRATSDQFIFDVMERTVAYRMQQRLTTFVDAMLLTEADRTAFARHAIENGVEVKVLLFDVAIETLRENNATRMCPVPNAVLQEKSVGLVRESIYGIERVTREDMQKGIVLEERRVIPDAFGLDVVGDVHGLFEQMITLLNKLGYMQVDTREGSVPIHPDGRRLLFLGDMVDRGEHSIDTLDYIRRAVEVCGHYAIRGNHEEKLLLFVQVAKEKKLKSWNSVASATTGIDLLRQPEARRSKLVAFLKSLPGYYVRGRMAFVHADIGCEFIAGNMTLSDCLYGTRSTRRAPAIKSQLAPFPGSESQNLVEVISEVGAELDSDAKTRLANNTYWVVRGHIPELSAGMGTVTVYDKGEFGGNLVSLWVPEGPVGSALELSRLKKIRVPTNFDYDDVIKKRSPLKRQLDALVKNGLVTKTVDEEYGLTLYKYGKRVFYDNLWGECSSLVRARGIVFDIAGAIVQNPFTKVFNLNENGATLPLETKIVAPLKMNGYMASVSLHPMVEDQLLVTTTGSFDSEFAKLTKKFMNEKRVWGPILRELKKLPRTTLLFEVLHPSDPHIVQYANDDMGFYLIGARECGPESLEMTEAVLDEMAAKIGDSVMRAPWERCTAGELIDKARSANNIEGWMIRLDDGDQKTQMKLKTPWYLTTKFVGRMTDAKVKHMYTNPTDFKKSIDEEFYFLVDKLMKAVTMEEFQMLEKSERVSLVASISLNSTVAMLSPKP